jgi:succinoglycan biosynthesis protein ExoO
MNAASPHVSVVMPAFNSARTVEQAIDAVLGQTMQDLELIVCNDASTDLTASVLGQYSDARVKVLENLKNLGPGLSRNRAIALAEGVWLGFIDADDSWAPNRLETLLRAADPEEDVVVFDDVVDCHDTRWGMVPWRELRGSGAFLGDGEEPVDVPLDIFVRQQRWLIQPLIPLRFIRKHAIWQSERTVHEDNEFILDCVASGAMLRYVPRAMYYYRITQGSATSNATRAKELRDVILKVSGRFPESDLLRQAFQEKLASIDREDSYMPFLMALKRCDFGSAIGMAYKQPWLVGEMLIRTLREIPYNLDRLRCGGRKRGVR